MFATGFALQIITRRGKTIAHVSKERKCNAIQTLQRKQQVELSRKQIRQTKCRSAPSESKRNSRD